jgi:dTDP-4-amino-4,6-dideoxygalactose transaminase
MPADKPIYVTKPFLPPLEELTAYLEQIWESRILTNGGPLQRQLEEALGDHLGVAHLSLVANCTLGLMVAMEALGIAGEVITTPYSFVASAHALLWAGMTPVFVDIDADTLAIDPRRIEAAITPQTSAIMPVHCYGIPCDVEAIEAIADRHSLRLIHDAAHAFGVKLGGRSVLNRGDLSVVSLHATKVFNTFEGGLIACRDLETKQRVDVLRNFGFASETSVVATGLNAKMSEFNAALGLVQLKYVEALIARRREIDKLYRQLLTGCRGIRCLEIPSDVQANHTYFPIFVEEEYPLSRDGLYERLALRGIHGRRYFYPLISDFPMYRDLPSAQAENLPVAHRISSRILCLPIYPDLSDAAVRTIAAMITDA